MSDNSNILNSMQALIAIVDTEATITQVNDQWLQFINAASANVSFSVGSNYFDTLRSVESMIGIDPQLRQDKVDKLINGIQAVLRGELPNFELKYPLYFNDIKHWFLVRVTPLHSHGTPNNELTGAVIMQIEITAQHLNTRAMIRSRAQMREAMAEESARRHNREMRALENLVLDGLTQPQHQLDPITEALISPVPVASQLQLLEGYNELLGMALSHHFNNSEYDISNDTRIFAHTLGYQLASPRDLISIHNQVLERKMREMRSPNEVKACIEEGRTLLLEALGYLTAFYRDLVLADLELTKM